MGKLDGPVKLFDKSPPKASTPGRFRPSANCRLICSTLGIGDHTRRAERVEDILRRRGMGAIDAVLRDLIKREHAKEVHEAEFWGLFCAAFGELPLDDEPNQQPEVTSYVEKTEPRD